MNIYPNNCRDSQGFETEANTAFRKKSMMFPRFCMHHKLRTCNSRAAVEAFNTYPLHTALHTCNSSAAVEAFNSHPFHTFKTRVAV